MLAGSDNIAHQQIVQLGIRGDSETQITSGVSAKDSVITSGGYGLPDKSKIRIEVAPAKEADADKSDEKSPEKSSDKSPQQSNDKTKPSGSEKE